MSSDTNSVVLSGALRRLEPSVDRVAASDLNVLLLGETGVGKDVLAREIHARSPRACMPLVSINCAALSESLLESELFGHERGAFTGAVSAKAGLLESADGGTIFLDEIGELPFALQAKLLRVVDNREVTRLGANRSKRLEARFIAATNRELVRDVVDGRFRRDLYFRLKGVCYRIPALRERVDEIEPLAKSFLEHAARMAGFSSAPLISADALAVLRAYSWPGNVRELRNTMARAVVASGGETLLVEHLGLEAFLGGTRPERRAGESLVDAPTLDGAADPLTLSAERARVLNALARFGGNQREAARDLGMARGTLVKRLVSYGVARPRKREPCQS